MKVRVVGSGSMWNEYNSASYMIDEEIIVDYPNGMSKNLFRMNINPRKINDIVITHFHGDHYFDLPFYLLLKSRSDEKIVNIYCGKEGNRKIPKILKLAFPNSCRDVLKEVNVSFNNSDSFVVGKYKVIRFVVDHGRMKPAYGYIFDDGNKKVGFTGDTAMCESVKIMASICDYLFCDCMFIEGNKKHMGIDNIKELMEVNGKCKFVVSHLENETRDKLKKLKLKNVIVPSDGDLIEVK